MLQFCPILFNFTPDASVSPNFTLDASISPNFAPDASISPNFTPDASISLNFDIFSRCCCLLKRYLKREYEKHLVVTNREVISHDPCINHCLLYTFGEYLKTNLNSTYHEEIQEYQDHILYYLAHQTRKTYLNAQFNAALLDLNEDGGLLVVDYKMKVLPKTARETKQEFFGKKGWVLHIVLLYTKLKDSVKINIQAIDHWSTDARQDA
ncbi:unnamed protein product [Rhizophagus irregularis]|nr:unnamed protein product [Rhizophagus irregularis]